MYQILGDESEEKRRKDELRSIISAMAFGWVFGAVLGGVFGGYRGFLVGIFAGSFLMSLFAMLGIRAERRERDRKIRREAAAAQSVPDGGLRRRR